MSSILRALKKLEHDPRHLEENRPLDTRFVPLAETAPHKSFAHILLITIGGGIICGLVLLAGWWVFSGHNETPSPTLPEIEQQVSTPKQSPSGPVVSDKTEQIQDAAGAAIIADPERIEKKSSEEITLPAQNNFPAAADMQSAGIQPQKLEMQQLNGPDMKLQAITWSRESHKRIAVINNRILHEGETVSGYLLVTINQDDVILGRNGKTWQLSFRIK